MKGIIEKLIKRFAWITLIVFILRCLISFEAIRTSCTAYMIFGYCGEAIGIVAVIFVFYERLLWKKDKTLKIPIFYKKYSGVFKTVWDNQEITRNIDLSIEQSLFSIKVHVITDESTSNSLSCSLDEILGRNTLVYTYINKPIEAVRDRSQIHYGTSVFDVTNIQHLTGYYFTDRKTTGDIFIDKVDN